MKRVLTFAAACIAAAAPFNVHGQEPRETLAIMGIESSGIDEQQAKALGEVLSTELSALGRYEVISAEDIKTMLQHEANRQSFGCDEATCFAEIGGALGADNLIVSQFSLLEDTYVVSIKLVDVKTARIIRRVYERVDGDLDDVLDAIRFSVGALMDPNAGEGVVRGRPLISTTPLVLGAASVAALAVGITFGLRANSLYDNATDPSTPGGQLDVASGEDAQLIANIGFATAAATGIGAAVLWLVWDSQLFDSQISTSLTPTPGGVGASLKVEF